MRERDYRLVHKKDGSYVLQVGITIYKVDENFKIIGEDVEWIDIETVEEKG